MQKEEQYEQKSEKDIEHYSRSCSEHEPFFRGGTRGYSRKISWIALLANAFMILCFKLVTIMPGMDSATSDAFAIVLIQALLKTFVELILCPLPILPIGKIKKYEKEIGQLEAAR